MIHVLTYLVAKSLDSTTYKCPTMHRGAFCQFPFRWIYYCHISKSTGKESGKTNLCAMYPVQIQSGLQMLPFYLVVYVHSKVILPDLLNRELQKGFNFI